MPAVDISKRSCAHLAATFRPSNSAVPYRVYAAQDSLDIVPKGRPELAAVRDASPAASFADQTHSYTMIDRHSAPEDRGAGVPLEANSTAGRRAT
jgi:hypothetical protein